MLLPQASLHLGEERCLELMHANEALNELHRDPLRARSLPGHGAHVVRLGFRALALVVLDVSTGRSRIKEATLSKLNTLHSNRSGSLGLANFQSRVRSAKCAHAPVTL